MPRRALFIGVVLAACTALAQPAPVLPAFPGHALVTSSAKDSGEVEFALPGASGEMKSGRVLHFEYRAKGTAAKPIAIVRHCEAAAKKRGGETLFERDDGTEAAATLTTPMGKSERWISVLAGADGYTLDVVELDEVPRMYELSVSDVEGWLTEEGYVVLDGLKFDAGKDTIKAGTEKPLANVVAFLREHPEVEVSIEGHTDDGDSPAANEALSKRRAERVRRHFVAKGIDAKRLTVKGWGAPDDRARNRIELVKKK